MKYLAQYTEEAQTKAFEENGAFFAFSDKQFNKAKVEGVRYTHIFGNLYCPVENAQKLLDSLENIHTQGVAEDIAENGKERIIRRELNNHEAFYTCDIADTVEALKSYGFTRDEIAEEYKKILIKQGHTF